MHKSGHELWFGKANVSEQLQHNYSAGRPSRIARHRFLSQPFRACTLASQEGLAGIEEGRLKTKMCRLSSFALPPKKDKHIEMAMGNIRISRDEGEYP